MATMYPAEPKEFAPESHEDVVFYAMRDNLPSDYHVFHSLTLKRKEKNNRLIQREIDFVIFHPQKGILCIEAKAGVVNFRDGEWCYGDGHPMDHGGPFKQADSARWTLMALCGDYFGISFRDKCLFYHAVWFMDVPKSNFQNVDLPVDSPSELILSKESLTRERMQNDIDQVFSFQMTCKDIKTNLNGKEFQSILKKILAPAANLISLQEVQKGRVDVYFSRMLEEQMALLSYLEDQPTAVINGRAGTGKTVMALEKAKRHSEQGENVLFLCYNRMLKDYLKASWENSSYDYNGNVDFFTIDGLAAKFDCVNFDHGSFKVDYEDLKSKLEALNEFPYQHIIIDEGQDFGKGQMEESEIISLLNEIAVLNDGTFYLFYDKNQLIQAGKIPKYISSADCKLTLYQNCRNTLKIAQTSLQLLNCAQKSDAIEKKISERWCDSILNRGDGDKPDLYLTVSDAALDVLHDIVANYRSNPLIKSIQILTCGKESECFVVKSNQCIEKINDNIHQYYYLYESDGKKETIPLTTCRRFKGLEADAVILTDMTKGMFTGFNNGNQIFYVGASRAKYKLSLVACLSEMECQEIIEHIEQNVQKIPRGRKKKSNSELLAEFLKARYVK